MSARSFLANKRDNFQRLFPPLLLHGLFFIVVGVKSLHCVEAAITHATHQIRIYKVLAASSHLTHDSQSPLHLKEIFQHQLHR